jgi:hypothetical protein
MRNSRIGSLRATDHLAIIWEAERMAFGLAMLVEYEQPGQLGSAISRAASRASLLTLTDSYFHRQVTCAHGGLVV